MDKSVKNSLIPVIVGLALTMCVGTIGYISIEGWDFLDSFYMTLITLATIGYGEIHPLSPAGRVFTIFLIFFGIGIAAYSFTTITALVIGGHLTDAFRRKKMKDKIAALSGHYIVCGSGHTGHTIAEELKKTSRPFVMVEREPLEAKKLIEKGHLVCEGDSTEDAVILEAGVHKAAGLFCCLTNDKDNAFTALTAQMLNPKLRIITTLHAEEVKAKLLKSGADSVISPGQIGGMRMVSEMVRPATVTFLDWMLREEKSNYRFEDIAIPASYSAKNATLAGLKGAQGNCALAVAIKNPRTGTYEINPSPDTKLEGGEVLVALGTSEQILELKETVKTR